MVEFLDNGVRIVMSRADAHVRHMNDEVRPAISESPGLVACRDELDLVYFALVEIVSNLQHVKVPEDCLIEFKLEVIRSKVQLTVSPADLLPEPESLKEILRHAQRVQETDPLRCEQKIRTAADGSTFVTCGGLGLPAIQRIFSDPIKPVMRGCTVRAWRLSRPLGTA